ncbi:MAG TPA: cysteine dioxygenase family protein [Ktedonobacterales bacterium]|nr:cysteine dioxygenase family protein [Ktedonobacterales bacterium]
MLQVETPLADFVADIEALVAAEEDPHRITGGVQRRLARLLAGPEFLTPQQREPDPAHYRSHLLAVAPSRKFSVVGLIWLPGQVTPIHDHICWCVVGVLQGTEREQRYGLRADGSGAHFLVPEGGETLTAGHTCALIPPEENIHQVRNAGDDLAISLHVYGEDIGVYGSSINQCFDDLPVREDTGGAPIAWRRTVWK